MVADHPIFTDIVCGRQWKVEQHVAANPTVLNVRDPSSLSMTSLIEAVFHVRSAPGLAPP